jgi:hypothetical protein
MTALRCTRTLLAQMGPNATRAAKSDELAESPLDWYANLLWIERRKCVLFTNVSTLFGFLIPDVRKADLRRLPDLFLHHLLENLECGDFGAAAVRTALELYGGPSLQRATNRSVLGSMNDYALQFRVMIDSAGGLRRCPILAINRRVSDSPMSAIGYSRGNQELRRVLAEACS